ncbi:MAG: DUF4097 domain-containing protein [bacterium]|nr:DUF4097 domain-containing protein [bacterium]
MLKKLSLPAFLFMLFSFSMTVFAVDLEIKDVEKKNFKVSPGGKLFLYNQDGRIDIESWDKDEVEVIVTKRVRDRNSDREEELMEEIDITYEHSGDDVDIRNRTFERRGNRFDDIFGSGRNRYIIIDFEIKVPENYNIELVNDDGDVELRNLSGDVSVEMDDGDTRLSNIKSDEIELNIDDGDVFLENISKLSDNSVINVECDDGRVIFEQCEAASVEIRNDDGRVELNELKLTKLFIIVDDCDVDGEIVPVGKVDIDIRTDDGDVDLYLPQNISAYFDLTSSDGRIRTNFDVEVEHRDDRSWVRERVGGGESEIRIDADGGYISIKYK